jgi:flavin-dependent dehydrogenase
LGKSAMIVEPGRHLGGMSSGGLSYTDMGDPRAVGGIAREFYRRVGAKYGKPEETHLEPHIAEQVFNELAKEAGIKLHFEKRLTSVVKNGARIQEIVTEDGARFRAKMFIDSTYEGDLMAKAGVTYTLLREANSKYGETLNGVQLFPRFFPELHWGKPGEMGGAKTTRESGTATFRSTLT